MFTSEEAIGASVLGFILVIYAVILLFAIAVNVISRWIFFKKCGEDGWKSLIPIYTDITLLKISELHFWWIFLIYASAIISILTIIFSIVSTVSTGEPSEFISIILSLLSFPLSLVTLFAKFNLSYNLAKKFNQGTGYAVLLFFFEPIMFFVFGLSKSFEFDKDVEVSPNGVIGANTTTSNSNEYCKECGSKVSKSDIYCQNCGERVR